jgi:hypothetical protein
MTGKREYCIGCHSDYYNHDNPQGVKECWHFKTAKVVKRLRIGWWTPQDKAENFYPVTTNSCHTSTGQYADYEKLPEHLRKAGSR